MTQFDQIYLGILNKCRTDGIEQYTDRVKMKTKALAGVSFTLDPRNFPILTLRKIPLKVFIAEQLWFLQGTKKLNFFQKFSKVWTPFADQDNTVESSYGYRWRSYFKRDQLASLIEMLTNESSSRQGVVITWDPATDGLASPKKKSGVPCGCMFTANIMDGKLYFHVVFRSDDIVLGIPHDVPGFVLLQHIIAQKVGVGLGSFHYSISNAQIYEANYAQASMLRERQHDHQEIRLQLPLNSFDRASAGDESLVEEIYQNLVSQYHPLPSLGKIDVAM